jgi:hypothetical protein
MFKKTILAHALTMAFMGAALTVGVATPAMAQSNASGSIFGDAGVPGATIVVRNVDTNLTRRVTADASGRYQITALPLGQYKVEVQQGDKVVNTSNVDVTAGQGAEASFGAAKVQSVRIAGTRSKIDVSNTNNGANFTACRSPQRSTPSFSSPRTLRVRTTAIWDRASAAADRRKTRTTSTASRSPMP